MRHSIQTFCFKFLMVYSAKHREYQLVKSQQRLVFFNSCYFHNVDFFQLWYAPAVPPELGAQRKFGGTLKKFSLCAGVCAPNFKTVSVQQASRWVVPTSFPILHGEVTLQWDACN